MYNDYFGFKEAPFSIAPDPRYLYMTAQHREALAHLVYGLNSEGGCILLTGEVGTGKTTICRCLLEQIPDQANVALVLNPKLSEIELLETICDELNISYPDADNSVKIYTDRIYEFLIRSNQNDEKTVLIIDEAQNLDSKVLEQLRLLTNLETNQRKLLQIIILGQPELLEILARNEMRQLAQRITARFHLQPLTRHEVKAYVSHRLAVAGQNIQLFPENSIKRLFRLSNGVPRLINIICDRALLGAYVENQYSVSPSTMKKAATEVFGELKNVERQQKNKRWLYPLAAFATIALLSIAAAFYFSNNFDHTDNGETVLADSRIINKQEPAADTSIPSDTTTASEVIPDSENTAGTLTPDLSLTETHPSDAAIAADSQPTTNSLETLLNQDVNNPVAAYQNLFKTWGQEYDINSNMTACKQAATLSLSCLHKQGNLNNLKIHNRPAVLTLVDNNGQTKQVTITAIDGELATINYSDRTYTVKLNELDRRWYGQFILLWKKPSSYRSAISPGENGEIVRWLSRQLAAINGETLALLKNRYDEKLVEQVIAFQTRQGLTADGIVGPLTIIHLNTQAGTDAPVLLKSKTAASTVSQAGQG